MQVSQVEVDFAFPYGEGCTPDRLRLQLSSLAEYWPGWHQFPWRVTRNLHHWLRREMVNFSYLMIQRCVTGYAAHLVLTAPFQDRDAVLRVMIAMRFEVAGLIRDLLLEAVRGEMLRTRKPYIQDCSGPEDWHEHVEPEEIERRRESFRGALEGVAIQFRTILNVAGMTNGKPGTMTLGRKIETWARGVEMPDAEVLEVRVEERGRYRILMPCDAEVEAMASAGKPVPRLIEGELRAAREELLCLGSGGTVCSGQVAGGGVLGAGKKKTRRRGGQETGDRGRETGDGGVGGCGAELVMRARGMTVVAMPGGGDVESCIAKALKPAGSGRLAAGSGRGCEEAKGTEETQGTGDGRQGTGDGEDPPHPAAPDGGPGANRKAMLASAGRGNAAVKHRGDRKTIREEVKRLIAGGLSQKEALNQVAGQAQQGHAGAHRLTCKYDMAPGFKATPKVVRQIYLSNW
jgi:uncharacterized protein YoaH (UPF0181 family)